MSTRLSCGRGPPGTPRSGVRKTPLASGEPPAALPMPVPWLLRRDRVVSVGWPAWLWDCRASRPRSPSRSPRWRRARPGSKISTRTVNGTTSGGRVLPGRRGVFGTDGSRVPEPSTASLKRTPRRSWSCGFSETREPIPAFLSWQLAKRGVVARWTVREDGRRGESRPDRPAAAAQDAPGGALLGRSAAVRPDPRLPRLTALLRLVRVLPRATNSCVRHRLAKECGGGSAVCGSAPRPVPPRRGL